MPGRCRRRPVGLLAPAFMDLLFSHPWIDERKRHPAMFSIHCEIGIQRQDGMPFMALGHQHDASVSKRHRRVAIFLKQLAERTEMLLDPERNLERSIVEEFEQGGLSLGTTPGQMCGLREHRFTKEKGGVEALDTLSEHAGVAIRPRE